MKNLYCHHCKQLITENVTWFNLTTYSMTSQPLFFNPNIQPFHSLCMLAHTIKIEK